MTQEGCGVWGHRGIARLAGWPGRGEKKPERDSTVTVVGCENSMMPRLRPHSTSDSLSTESLPFSIASRRQCIAQVQAGEAEKVSLM